MSDKKNKDLELNIAEEQNNQENINKKNLQDVKKAIEDRVNDWFEKNKEKKAIRKLVSISRLIDAGAHISLPIRKKNPKMEPFLYPTTNNKINYFDMLKTTVFLSRAYLFIMEVLQKKPNSRIMLVGTTSGKIISDHVKAEAERVNAYYINQRWLGGILTNFKTVSKSIKKLVDLKKLQASEEFSIRSKNEQLMIGKQIAKMERFIGGISTMREMPSIIIVSDLVQEKNAVMEARKMNIPVIAIANSNANPNDADFIIPANSHSVRAIYLIISVLCDAIAELNGKETMVVGKNDNEIFLPQDTKKVQSQNIINHKKFGRFANNKDSTSEEKTI